MAIVSNYNIRPITFSQVVGAAVAPQASNLLKKVAGDYYTARGDLLKSVANFFLPKPLERLAGAAIDFNTGTKMFNAEMNIDMALSQFIGLPHNVDVGGQYTTVPGLQSRTYSSTIGNSWGTNNQSIFDGRDNNIGSIGTRSLIDGLPNVSTRTSDQVIAELKRKYPNMKQEDLEAMAAQEVEQRYNRMIMLLTAQLQMRHETTKAIQQNHRV